MTTQHTARFVKQAHAISWAADTARWSPKISNVVRHGKTVTFDLPEVDRDFILDLAEFIGYHGSPPQGPVATLDGNRTPRSY